MKFLIITGMSGAGKTQAMHCLEDMGYYCIDNMPPLFLTTFAKVCYTKPQVENVAIACDIRGGEMFENIEEELDNLREEGFNFEIIYLDASDDVLIKRFKESRRSHPLAKDGHILTGIKEERKILENIKLRADFVIDTSELLLKDLRAKMQKLFGQHDEDYFSVNIMSFGYKYGIPMDSDLVWDVRFLPNPFYIDHLKPLSGLDSAVSEYVLSFEQSKDFLKKTYEILTEFVPYYKEEGKRQLVVSIGCTGGRHRSVAIATELTNMLIKGGFRVSLEHRDKDIIR